MRFILCFLLFAISLDGFTQEKTNYNKDIYPLIKSGNYTEVLPLLEKFLQEKPDHINANYWFAKILESEGRNSSNPELIKKAGVHYAYCFNNASELEMTMATAGRYPDVSGIESTERLNNFKRFLRFKYEECETLEQKLKQENEVKKREELQAEIQRKSQSEADAKIKMAEFSALTIDEFVAKTGLTEIKKILGSYSESLVEEGGDWNFKYEYNSINGTPSLNGKISGSFRGQLSSFEGELHNGDGYITFFFENENIQATQAIKCYYQQNKCTKLRCETLSQSSQLFYFELTNVEGFDAERFLEITDSPYDVKKAEKKLIGNRFWPITRFQGYSNSEEGILQNSFNFLPVIKRNGFYYVVKEPITILEENTKLTQTSMLKNETSIDKYFELKCEVYLYESEIFTKQDSVYELKTFKEVFVFIPEFYAEKYKEIVSAEELGNLNALAKKWHESILNGNYEVYKAVTAKGVQWNLEEFTKFNKEYQKIYSSPNPNSKYKFQKSSNYLVTSGDVVITRESEFNKLKNEGADLKKLIILFGVYTQDAKEERSLVFVKENGTWKVGGGKKITSTDRDIDKYKAYQVISKENLTPCNCIEKVISGDVYGAEKCAFFFTYKKLENKTQTFEECFKTLNYCDYEKQCESMVLNLGYSNSQKLRECKGQ